MLILFVFICGICIQQTLSIRLPLKKTSISMSKDVTVVGLSGGVAETIAVRLLERGSKVALILNEKPISPMLSRNGEIDLYTGDIEQNPNVQKALNGKVVVAAVDTGEDAFVTKSIDEDSEREASSFSMKIANVFPKTLKSLLLVTNVATESNSNKLQIPLFPKPRSLRSWCQENGIPCSTIQYGSLIGGIPGREPLPFVGMPLIEPELHPSYVYQSVIWKDPNGNKYASSELVTRDSLAEVAVQSILREATLDTQVVSIAGPKPSEKEWNQLFTRATASSGAELFRVEFSEIRKPQLVVNWIVETWFPTALIEADAATILTGARPVRAAKTNVKTVAATAGGGDTASVLGTVIIYWEDMQPDLTVRSEKGLEIKLIQNTSGSNSGALTVTRLSKGGLPGEASLVDKLVEGVNQYVLKKQLCIPAVA